MAEKGGVYVIDQPATGLHLVDVGQLPGLLDRARPLLESWNPTLRLRKVEESKFMCCCTQPDCFYDKDHGHPDAHVKTDAEEHRRTAVPVRAEQRVVSATLHPSKLTRCSRTVQEHEREKGCGGDSRT